MSLNLPSLRRSLVVGAALMGALATAGCGPLESSGDSGSWRSAARCQPPGGGWQPEQVLPDPKKCPEAYRGNGTSTGPGVVVDPGEPYTPKPTPPCSSTESLNGFHCENVDPWGNPGPYYPPGP